MSKAKGIYKLKAGTKFINVKLDMNALCELEDMMGEKIPNIGEMVSEKRIGIKECRAFLWAGLLHENPTITVQEAGDIMSKVGFKETMQCVMPAMVEALTGGSKPAAVESATSKVESPEKN